MLLHSELTVGMEIEAIAFESNYNAIKNILKGNKTETNEWSYAITGDCSIAIDPDIDDLSEFEICNSDGSVTYDREQIVPFEIDTGYFSYTPENQLKFRKLLVNLYKSGIITNSTCSLHVHFKPKFLNMRTNEAKIYSVMLLAYIVESKLYEKYLKFQNQDMTNTAWSSVDYMIDEYNFYKNAKSLYSKYEYRNRGLFHVHEQGTLEWRGNRKVFDCNPIIFCNNHSSQYEQSIVKHSKFMFSFLNDMFNAMNGKVDLDKKDSLYWKLYDNKNLMYSKLLRKKENV